MFASSLRFGDVLQWKLEHRTGEQLRAYCYTHNATCAVGVEPHSSVHRHSGFSVEGAGPTCCPFSVSGKKLKARGLVVTSDSA